MKKKLIATVFIGSFFFITFAAFGWQEETPSDKITIYKGKNEPMLDPEMNFCKGAGEKCADLTTSQLKEIINAIRQ